MGGGGHDTAQIGQFLLPRQSHLRGHQRLAHRMGFAGDAAGICRQEDDPDHDRKPEPQHEEIGQFQNRAINRRQRNVEIGQKRDHQYRHGAQKKGGAQGQRRGRDGDRREDQQGERVVQPPGQEQQERQLRQIEQQRQHRVSVAEALVLREDRHRDQVRDDPRADGQETQAQFDPEAQIEADHDHGDRLPKDRQPTQHQERAQTHPVAGRIPGDERD